MKVVDQISDRTVAFLTETFCDFTEPLQANAGEKLKILLRPLLFNASQFN
jgi:hypothetical protein